MANLVTCEKFSEIKDKVSELELKIGSPQEQLLDKNGENLPGDTRVYTKDQWDAEFERAKNDGDVQVGLFNSEGNRLSKDTKIYSVKEVDDLLESCCSQSGNYEYSDEGGTSTVSENELANIKRELAKYKKELADIKRALENQPVATSQGVDSAELADVKKDLAAIKGVLENEVEISTLGGKTAVVFGKIKTEG